MVHLSVIWHNIKKKNAQQFKKPLLQTQQVHAMQQQNAKRGTFTCSCCKQLPRIRTLDKCVTEIELAHSQFVSTETVKPRFQMRPPEVILLQ